MKLPLVPVIHPDGIARRLGAVSSRISETLSGVVSGEGRTHRRIWSATGKAHIELRGAHKIGTDDFRAHVEKALSEVEGVHWAEVNAVAGRVIVALDPEGPSIEDLIEVVEGVEELHEVDKEKFPHDKPDFPGDNEPLHRHAIALAGDVAGMGIGVVGMFASITPLPGEIASVVAFADNERRVKGFLEKRFGRTATEIGIGLTNAAVQAFGEGPLNLIVDGVNRATLIGEIVSRRRVWESREGELSGHRHVVPLEPFEHTPRPVPMPKGPVERFADRSAIGAVGGFGIALATTRNPRRAVNAFSAGIPKAARLGREAFAAHLGRELADRGILVMDANVLRHLDRVDTVVIDHEVIATPNGDLDPMMEIVATAARGRGHDLVVAGVHSEMSGTLGADRHLPGGHHLKESILTLQREGRVVLLLAANKDHAAMRAADVSVCMAGRGTHVPWGADLIAHATLDDAWFVLEATETARQVSKTAVAISAAGSAIGGVWSMLGPTTSASRRTSIPVNTSSLLAQSMGTVSAVALGRRRCPLPASTVRWHEMDPADVMAALSTERQGLSSEEVVRREPARPPQEQANTGIRLSKAVAGELANPLTPILGIGVGLSAAVGSVTDAALVAGVVGVNAMVSGFQRVRTEISLERLVRISGSVIGVRRDGETTYVGPDAIVRGDVVELEAGDVVPADCRIIEASACEVDESTLTGESLPVSKQSGMTPGVDVADRSCMLYEGSTVVNGSVLAVVVATGEATEAGRALVGAPEPPPSGVEERLRKLTTITIPATLVSGAAVTGMSLLRGQSVRNAVSSGVSLMVAAVPEGLPLLATVAQLGAARRLSERNALVRNPRTIEALGRVDVLCFDKTGTLTEGHISLQRVSDGSECEGVGEISGARRRVLGAALRASPQIDDDEILLHATDRAVATGAERAGVGVDEGVGKWSMLNELAFESVRGFHAVVGTNGKGHLVTVKGAPEIVLPRCTTWQSPDGPRRIDARIVQRLSAEVEAMATKGLRVLAVAERTSSSKQEIDEERVTGMELLGFLGLADSVRPEASAAVSGLRRAGVDVAMITGDHPSTAEAIASELGIINGKGVMTGAEIDAMDDSHLDAALDKVSVFARVTPSHKVRIVGAYQRTGRTVAMTGDGANDAAAIRLADTGIALGSRGSQSAIDAADVVVVDDKIETIIDAIVEGRAMWASVRDALSILVGGNLGEVAFTVAATAIGGSSPLGARQLLLVNMLTDMLPAMTITLRPPLDRSPEALLHEGPDASLGGALAKQIIVRAIATGGGATGAWLIARGTGTARRASTVGLATVVGTQLAQTAVVGRRSPLVLASTVASAATMAAIVQTPGVSQFFGCTPMGPVAWSIVLGSTSVATGASIVAPWLFDRIAGARYRDIVID